MQCLHLKKTERIQKSEPWLYVFKLIQKKANCSANFVRSQIHIVPHMNGDIIKSVCFVLNISFAQPTVHLIFCDKNPVRLTRK